MSAYVVRRLLLFVPALVGASMLIFVLMRLVPGDIAEILVYQTGSETSGVQQKQIQRIRQELGLTKPVMVQYLAWMGGAVRGDFGKSYTQRRPVWDILRERFPRSMELAILTLAIALIWAIPLGVISAVHQNRPLDYVARIASLSALSIPLFVSGALACAGSRSSCGATLAPTRARMSPLMMTRSSGLRPDLITRRPSTIFPSIPYR